MTHKCCVRDCEEIVKETRSKGLPLHKFPKDVLLRSKWLTSGGFEADFKPTTSQIVCYKHFKQADYEIGRSHKLFLKKGSVPTIFNDYDNHPDPIGPSSAVITSRLQAREFRLSQAAMDLDGSNNVFETSCSSLEASMDSSNSLHSGFLKKDCDLAGSHKEEGLEMTDTEGTGGKDFNSPIKTSAFLDTENIVKMNSVSSEQTSKAVVDEKKKIEEESKSKMSNRAGLSFLPGSKLEAKDFNDKWYSARVVETDWIEREVLIHFDKWSIRYDEWIPMDSSRLRVLQIHSKDLKMKEFNVGERILATWVDGKKYPAKIIAVLGGDKYDVLFDDGYSKILKASKMTKLLEMPALKLEEDSYVGSKQERRDKKRKHTITELFHTHSKKKIKTENERMVKNQDGDELHNIKCIPKVEPGSSAVKTEQDYGTDLLQRTLPAGNLLGGAEEDYATFIGNLRVEIEDSTYKCPKAGCNKNFRKENLLQMHIKHYHPEYSKFLGSTPNVADLAYARTIGESVEDLMPKKSRTSSSAQVNQTFHGVVPAISYAIDKELNQVEIDNKLEIKQPAESHLSPPEDNSSEPRNSCTMSPGTLFDLRSKEEKIHTGIKTLLPVKQPTIDDSEQSSSALNENQKATSPNDKLKVHHKKPHHVDLFPKIKKQKSMSEQEEHYDHYDDTLIDREDALDLNYKCTNVSNSRSETDNNDSTLSKGDNVILINGELIKVEKLRREEIINCTCGYTEEDGLMIQCDLCLCWQHGHCNAIEKETDVPEKYVCYICQNSHRQRKSTKYIHDQDWIREGKLPALQDVSANAKILNERTATLKRCYDLIAGLIQIQNLLHSLRVKINIVQNKDHPKLYLWAKNWSKIKIPHLKTEPVPIMETIKVENDLENNLENNPKEKLEFSFSIKNDPDQKLITSDTELMKILEEDSTQAEESKPLAKISASNNFKDEGRILLDALTKNGLEDQPELLTIKTEIDIDDTPTKQNLSRYAGSEKVAKLQNSTQTEIKPSIIVQPIVPEPEAPIDPVECKLRLLEHIDDLQNYVESALSFAETQLTYLEEIHELKGEDDNHHKRTKQLTQMQINDLELIRKLAALC